MSKSKKKHRNKNGGKSDRQPGKKANRVSSKDDDDLLEAESESESDDDDEVKFEEFVKHELQDLKTVENELHFVFDCPTYSQLRLVYYNWIIKIYPDFLSLSQTEKLKVMLTDKRVIQKSGLFIQNCFLTRTSKLFVQTDS